MSHKQLTTDERFVMDEINLAKEQISTGVFDNMYIVKNYGPPTLLTYSMVYYNFFEAVHACLKQNNSCVIRAISLCHDEQQELFVPRSI